MRIEARSTDANGLSRLCWRAAQVLSIPETETHKRYRNIFNVLNAVPIVLPPPTTRKEAVPDLLLVGPFQDEPEILGVDIYAGIGFIEVRETEGHFSYGLGAIRGPHQESRVSYLAATLRLYLDDVRSREDDRELVVVHA